MVSRPEGAEKVGHGDPAAREQAVHMVSNWLNELQVVLKKYFY